jgi:CelD/BcsL family acetyltransferase involved in cellulose biosynthesis
MATHLVVQVEPFNKNKINSLAKQWLALEQKANNSIFTSWAWISTWLAYINYHTDIVRITFNNQTIGLGFLNTYCNTRNGITINQLWLNRTGDNNIDQIWNEYNDLLCEAGVEYAVRAALIDYFDQNQHHIDELIIGASTENICETPHASRIIQHTSWQTHSYLTLLTGKTNLNDMLAQLSRNTRYQINRTIKLLGGIDNIKLTPAETKQQALQFFKEAGELHKTRWINKNSGFNNPAFVNFHQQLIEQQFESGLIELLKISTPHETLGYLYNFIYNETAYFYLSGLHYHNDNRLKPGLLSHALAITHYAQKGLKYYDFMGGEGRYKNSFADQKGSMVISNFRRKTLPFRLSQLIRQAKHSTKKLLQLS